MDDGDPEAAKRERSRKWVLFKASSPNFLLPGLVPKALILLSVP